MLGQMADTNSAWLSAWLSARGVSVVRHVSVGDDLAALTAAIADSHRDHEVTLVTGGLGPTEDDLTRLAVSRALGLSLGYRPELAKPIIDFMLARGFACSDNNLRQAWLPGGSVLVENPWGTAPAFAILGKARLMLFVPGVPQEMKNIVNAFLPPKLEETFPTRLGYHRTTILRASSLGESLVDDLLSDLIRGSANPVMGLLAGPFETRILITSKARDAAEADALEAPLVAETIKRLGKYYVGQGDQTMVTVSCGWLRERSLRLGIVDSLTRGSAGEPFAKNLPPENVAGFLATAEKGIGDGVAFLLGAPDADLVAVIQKGPPPSRDDPAGPEMSVKARLLAKGPDGPREVASAQRLVGRSEAIGILRAGALLSLTLWDYLRVQGQTPKGGA